MKKTLMKEVIIALMIMMGFVYASCSLEDLETVTETTVDEDQQEEEETSDGSDSKEDEEDSTPDQQSSAPEFNETKAFPTAEGYGKFAQGGRGGKIVYVTSLENSGPGTLREACEAVSGPRIVLFKVSGIINLYRHIKIKEPYITIAGQTAPGSGITLKNAGFQIETYEVIIRHLRIRPGDDTNPEYLEGTLRDAFYIYPNRNCHNIVLDHMTFTWGIDENLTFSTGTNNITMQNCIIAEGLSNSLHNEGEHSKGLLMLNQLDNISMINNLFAHNRGRNPLISSNSRNVHLINNLIYGWGGDRTGWGTHTQMFVDDDPIQNTVIYGNVYRKDSESNDWPLYTERNFRRLGEGTTFYIDNNYLDENGTLENMKNRDNDLNSNPDYFTWWLLETPPSGWRDTYSTIKDDIDDVADYVLANAGARKPILDEVDERIINEARTYTGRIIDSPSDVGGYPAQYTSDVPEDSDNDGMPDKWEIANNLDPNSADDAYEYTLSSYYQNIEMYLSELAGDF